MNRRFPLVTAHAGCMGIAPHTLRSVRAGLDLGADVVEEDIRVTKDGIAVLAHDDELPTADGPVASIAEMTYAELSGLLLLADQGGREGGERETFRLLKLEDILPLVQASGKSINLDLKVDEAIEPAAALVRKFGLEDRAFYSGCQRDRALLARTLEPELRRMLNADVELFKTLPYDEAMAITREDALAAGCSGINVYHGIATKAFVDYAAERGLPVYVWTVEDEALMRRYADWGVGSITSRDVETLLRAKREWTAPNA
ncbi:glycerophosphodiester phosphodiesterase [Paenibacillus sp. GCM10023250]|uniref:glycerophosphodiester phosphodiesterase n=1 Tax=Paenibacillus sp. GCM10023250 TaxID=3252648 RepID=UPI003612D725